MSASALSPPRVRTRALRLEDLGELVPISRAGGQGRVYRPTLAPAEFARAPVVVKLYRRAPPERAAGVLAEMVAWAGSLHHAQRESLEHVAAWPLALVWAGKGLAGIVMRDVSGRFAAPFVMPSGRRERVLLTLEHLLGGDDFLELRGLGVRLDTPMRARVAERVCAGLAFLHRNAIVASDIAPNNLLVAVDGPEVCFIDCDSMVFRGRQPLDPVQTGDWNLPAEFGEAPNTRAADAYKLGLVILRLFARSHDARTSAPYLRYVPVELRDLLARALDGGGVNRPPAGEWQPALRGVLADGGLGVRYPGPAPAPRPAIAGAARARPVVAAAPPARTAARPAPAPVIRLPPQAPAGARAATAAPRPRPATPGRGWLRRSVVVMWLVAGTMVLAVLLSRLFAAAIPTDNGFGSSSNQSAPYGYQYYYYPPPGRGSFGPPSGAGQIP